MNKGTIVISGFQGIGKSYLVSKGFGAMDIDSTIFKWAKGKEGEERHPDFPNNYIEHIKYNLGVTKYIFVSSHEEVRDALKENNIKYYNVYPDKMLKAEYLERYVTRGSPQSFVDLMDKEFTNLVNEMDEDTNPHKIKIDKRGQYLEDVVEWFDKAKSGSWEGTESKSNKNKTKKKYSFSSEYRGNLQDLIKDREYGKEVYENQYRKLSKVIPISTLTEPYMLDAMGMLVSLIGILVLGQRLLRLMGGSVFYKYFVIAVMSLLAILLVAGLPIIMVKNKVNRGKYLEEFSKIDKDTYFKIEKEDSVKTLKQALDENNKLLKLYKLVEGQRRERVEVYAVDEPVVHSEGIPRDFNLHDLILFKEGNTYYQVASKGKSYMKIYIK